MSEPFGYTPEQLTKAIARAIGAHDVEAVEGLLKMLAVTDSAQAQAVYDTIRAGLAIAERGDAAEWASDER